MQIKGEITLTGGEVGVSGSRRHRLVLLEHVGEVEVLEPIDIDGGAVLIEQSRERGPTCAGGWDDLHMHPTSSQELLHAFAIRIDESVSVDCVQI